MADGIIKEEEENKAATLDEPPVNLSKAPFQEVVCFDCGQPIKGVIVRALSQTWHPEHFCCAHCKQPINGQKFNVEDSKPYCVDDYTQLFLKRCQGCNLPIRDVVVVALNSYWHFDHFVCAGCGSRLANSGFYEREKNAFCHTCYEERFCPRCVGCSKPIVKTAVLALGEKWHQECFKCSKCSRPIAEPTFEICNGKQLCDKCLKPEELKIDHFKGKDEELTNSNKDNNSEE